MKRLLKFIVSLLIIVIAAAAVVWLPEIRTISSLKQVGDNQYLYSMDYHAHYDLDDVLAANLGANKDLLNYVLRRVTKGIPVKLGNAGDVEKAGSFACTSFQVKDADSDGYFYGRNYDFFKNPTLVTTSHPRKGYASIAVSDMSHFGYSLDKLPVGFAGKALSIASIYAPVDGINEKGLCTSIMALPNQPAQQDNGKPIAGTTIIMRLWLDRCATVQEALDLLETVDVRHDVTAGSGYHYMVADANGDCAIVEFDLFDGWKTMVVRKPVSDNSMLITNHLLNSKYYTTEPDPVYGNPHSKSWWRYETAGAYLAERNGILSLDEAKECLSLVHWKDLKWDNGMVEDTQHSAVYDQSNPTLYLRSWYDWDTTEVFTLK